MGKKNKSRLPAPRSGNRTLRGRRAYFDYIERSESLSSTEPNSNDTRPTDSSSLDQNPSKDPNPLPKSSILFVTDFLKAHAFEAVVGPLLVAALIGGFSFVISFNRELGEIQTKIADQGSQITTFQTLQATVDALSSSVQVLKEGTEKDIEYLKASISNLRAKW